nr:SprT family zinc-dependent metalloprotease [Clostridium chromiireducens]
MKLKFKYGNKEIEFSLVRKKRKTICIKLEDSGEVIVSAPLRTSKEYILLVVKNKALWILEKQKEIQQRTSRKVKRDFATGSTFMYLGEEYPCKIISNEKNKKITIDLVVEQSYEELILNNEYTNINNIEMLGNKLEKTISSNKIFIINTNTMDNEKIKMALEKWYRAETLKIVQKRIDFYAVNFKDRVTEIRVKEQKRRWASCTGKNAILFNWRCSMARADVLDYIVIHEMCHMDHRNHSKYFWNRVSEIMPDYKEKHEWLRKNGINLYI